MVAADTPTTIFLKLRPLNTKIAIKPKIRTNELNFTKYAREKTNPATEDKQDDLITAIGNISIPAPAGGATEDKQDATITAIQTLQGLQIPIYDTEIVDETDPNSIVITYKKDGATVATKNITIIGAVTTTTITL